jgi:hypothetical protein
VFRPPLMQMLLLLRVCRPHPQMLCCVDGLRAWSDALPPGVSSGCFAVVIIYGFTSLLATNVLSSIVLGSVNWGCQVEGPPHVSCFSFVLWTSLVIHGLLVNPMYRLLYCSFGSSS